MNPWSSFLFPGDELKLTDFSDEDQRFLALVILAIGVQNPHTGADRAAYQLELIDALYQRNFKLLQLFAQWQVQAAGNRTYRTSVSLAVAAVEPES